MKILVDTSVWIDAFRRPDSRLEEWLREDRVVIHPMILGELAMGSLKNRRRILNDLSLLPGVPAVNDDETRWFIDQERIFGLGLSWVDAHLLASARLAGCGLATRDRAFLRTAGKLGIKCFGG